MWTISGLKRDNLVEIQDKWAYCVDIKDISLNIRRWLSIKYDRTFWGEMSPIDNDPQREDLGMSNKW